MNLIAVGLFYKELKISSFDPALATTLGISARFMHYMLMVLVAITTVAAFEAIGSILVIAMLIVPAASAYLLTQRVGSMIAVSLIMGAAAAGIGHVGAITLPPIFSDAQSASTAGSISRRRRMVASPSKRGMCMSSSSKCTSSLRTMSTASRPSASFSTWMAASR